MNGVYMVVHAIIQPAIEIPTISTLRLDHINGSGLTSTFVTTSAVARQKGRVEASRQATFCFQEGSLHGWNYFVPCENISLNGIAFPNHAACPGKTSAAGKCCRATLRVHQTNLSQYLIRIIFQQISKSFRGGKTLRH